MIKFFYMLALMSGIAAVSPAYSLSDKVEVGPIQLAGRYDNDIHVVDYFISEKLDGIRARWTGQQLITRNGNVIHAPAWFTAHWPPEILDGELWTKRGDFENIASIVLTHTPDERWREVKMMVFDTPLSDIPFATRLLYLRTLVQKTHSHTLVLVPQFRLDSLSALEAKMDAITAAGGEGLMLHHRHALYENGRSQQLLKAKRYQDDEAKVIAYVKGRGKLTGLMGSLLVTSPQGKQFKIGSGFSQRERQHPPPIGSWITYKYYGVTKKGIPRFASFLHVRPDKDRP